MTVKFEPAVMFVGAVIPTIWAEEGVMVARSAARRMEKEAKTFESMTEERREVTGSDGWRS